MTIEVKPAFTLITDIINGVYVKEKYVFYNKKGAIKKFKQKYYEQQKLQSAINLQSDL